MKSHFKRPSTWIGIIGYIFTMNIVFLMAADGSFWRTAGVLALWCAWLVVDGFVDAMIKDGR